MFLQDSVDNQPGPDRQHHEQQGGDPPLPSIRSLPEPPDDQQYDRTEYGCADDPVDRFVQDPLPQGAVLSEPGAGLEEQSRECQVDLGRQNERDGEGNGSEQEYRDRPNRSAQDRCQDRQPRSSRPDESASLARGSVSDSRKSWRSPISDTRCSRDSDCW